HEEREKLLLYQVTQDVSIVHQVLNALYHHNIQSVLVEGGQKVLQSFIDEDIWDEAYVITNTEMYSGQGIKAPSLQNCRPLNEQEFGSNRINTWQHSQN
ncbi:MAG TPA: dihydrofolate reductase family protein, partial [Flavitalea sp.]|nr:dihydrofolate reductase family protein [Flavitalea sp.]